MSSPDPTQLEEGLEVPIHRSLLDPMLLAGLPRTFAYVFFTITAAIALGLRELWVLPGAFVVHAVCAKLVQSDPHFFTVLAISLKDQRRLDP